MELHTITAPDKPSAIALIEQNVSKTIELDYESGAGDMLELGRLGRQHGVAVLFRSQEAIVVESLRALRCGLEADKSTWLARHLLCQFELATIPADDVKRLRGRAAELGDLIVPVDDIQALYTHWKH